MTPGGRPTRGFSAFSHEKEASDADSDSNATPTLPGRNVQRLGCKPARGGLCCASGWLLFLDVPCVGGRRLVRRRASDANRIRPRAILEPSCPIKETTDEIE